MHSDPDLFTLKPLTDTPMANYRKDGPETSRAGAVAAEESGAAKRWREILWRYVTTHPHLTAGEIASGLDMERGPVSKRLPELRRLGLLRNGPARKCRESGIESMTWEAAEPAGGEP